MFKRTFEDIESKTLVGIYELIAITLRSQTSFNTPTEYANIHVVVGNQDFHLHDMTLGLASPMLKAMLMDRVWTREPLDADPRLFTLLIRAIYANTLEHIETPEDFVAVWFMANQYLVDVLRTVFYKHPWYTYLLEVNTEDIEGNTMLIVQNPSLLDYPKVIEQVLQTYPSAYRHTEYIIIYPDRYSEEDLEFFRNYIDAYKRLYHCAVKCDITGVISNLETQTLYLTLLADLPTTDARLACLYSFKNFDDIRASELKEYLETLSPMTTCHKDVFDAISLDEPNLARARGRFIDMANYIFQHEFIRCIEPLVKWSLHAMTLLPIVYGEAAVIEIRRRRSELNIFYRDAVILRDRYPHSEPIQTMIAPSLQLVTREQVSMWIGCYLYSRTNAWVTEEAIDYLFPLVQMVDMYSDEDDTMFRMFETYPAFEELTVRSTEPYHDHYRAFSFLTRVFRYVAQQETSTITDGDRLMHLSEENREYIRTEMGFRKFDPASSGPDVYTKLLVETVIQRDVPLQRLVETLSLIVP